MNIRINMRRFLKYLTKVNIVKTLIINFRVFGLFSLFKCPIIVEYWVDFRNSGLIKTNKLNFGMLYISSNSKVIIKPGGILSLYGDRVFFNSYNRVIIGEFAEMRIGNNFSSNTRTDYNCMTRIEFGNNVLVSSNVIFLDTDYHKIYDEDGQLINKNDAIVIGDSVWIGYGVTILKGTKIGSNVVVGACSLLNGQYSKDNSIYAGNPAKLIKVGIRWDY